jgi:hypothetical protein
MDSHYPFSRVQVSWEGQKGVDGLDESSPYTKRKKEKGLTFI